MNSHADLVRGWLLKGDSDLAASRLLAEGTGPYDTACFHAQQAVEKYLKAFLVNAGIPFPMTHNLEQLERRCAAASLAPDFTGLDLARLTPYAVELRYDPEFWPDKATAHQALSIAAHARAAVLAALPAAVHP